MSWRNSSESDDLQLIGPDTSIYQTKLDAFLQQKESG